MAQFFTVHPSNPQPRLIKQAVALLRDGAVMAYPTDSSYALGCRLGDKDAVGRIRQLRGMDEHHLLTLVCRDLSEIAHYAKVDNARFRLLKSNTPGSYTFILDATREVPRRLQHPKRSTVGVRVPDHPVALALLEELGEPLLSSTLILPGADEPLSDAWQVRDELEHQLELIVDGGAAGLEPTTVIDLSGESPVLLRRGKGALAPFGLAD